MTSFRCSLALALMGSGLFGQYAQATGKSPDNQWNESQPDVAEFTLAQLSAQKLGQNTGPRPGGDVDMKALGIPKEWAGNESGYIDILKEAIDQRMSLIARQNEIVQRVQEQDFARRTVGLLQPIYDSAERITASWFYWVAFAAIIAGIAWFLSGLVSTFYDLTRRKRAFLVILPTALGLFICVTGLLFTTHAAVYNSGFAFNTSAILTAGIVGTVTGIVVFQHSGSFLAELYGDDLNRDEGHNLLTPQDFLAPAGVHEQKVEITAEALDIRSEDLEEMETGAAINVLVEGAARMSASDLFFLADYSSVAVSVRRFGKLTPIAVLPPSMGRRLISHVKAMAGMDISEHRRALDGRWIYDSDDYRIDLRVNTTPTVFGEDMALRLWNRMSGFVKLDELGMSLQNLTTLKAMLAEPSGLILVTGPTGAGKTTTLYACLQHLANGHRKLNTIEDPVEYILPGVRQSQVNESIGADFPHLLRSVFRQAPDVIMIGEIRDAQTAATAVRAANSGHLVLATLHAPTASGAVQSMRAFGIKSFFLSTSLLGSIAQRLVRTLCPKCRTFVDLSESSHTFEDIREMLDDDEGHGIYGPGKCDACHSSGYLGRTGLFEIIRAKKQIRDAIASGATSREIEQVAISNGMTEFRRAALVKVAKGVTSTEDILRDIPAEQLGLDD